MPQNENEAFKEAEKLNEFVNDPSKELSSLEQKFYKIKEGTKETIKVVLPQSLKPIMEGDSGDIILLVVVLLIIGLFMKVIGLALRIIFRFIFIASIIAALYIIFQKFS